MAPQVSPPVLAAVALGSSLGDRRRHLDVAVRLLDATPGLEVVATSRFYRTPPAGGVARNPFWNAVVLLRCGLSPEALLAVTRSVEVRVGRRPGPRWSDRVVDLDVLLVGDEIRRDPGFCLPHPRIGQRAFVLVPLAEVAPFAVDPVTGVRWAGLPVPRPLPAPVIRKPEARSRRGTGLWRGGGRPV